VRHDARITSAKGKLAGKPKAAANTWDVSPATAKPTEKKTPKVTKGTSIPAPFKGGKDGTKGKGAKDGTKGKTATTKTEGRPTGTTKDKSKIHTSTDPETKRRDA
jgi:hypothetical protein